MDDKTGALEKIKVALTKAEQVDLSLLKIGDIIYVSLDEEDGLILKGRFLSLYLFPTSLPFVFL